MLIEIQDIHKSYRCGDLTTLALRGVSLSIDKSEFTAIVGPSGSGKTTLLNIIGGLDSPTSGHLMINGTNIDTLSATKRAEIRLHQIGFVFQSYNLIPVLTAVENVEYVMLLQGVSPKSRREQAMAILEVVGLADMAQKRPNQLSGGQQQRVAVARAIVAKPSLVLADEPTANLDSATGEALLDMMYELNQQYQTTFIFSTHDQMVMDRARRLVILHDGQVHQDQLQPA